MAGYSGTPLVKKLGIKENFKIALLHAPDKFEKELGALPAGVKHSAPAQKPLDFILFFAKSQGELQKNFTTLLFLNKISSSLYTVFIPF